MKFYPVEPAVPLADYDGVGYLADEDYEVAFAEDPESVGYFAEDLDEVGYAVAEPYIDGEVGDEDELGFGDPPPGFTEGVAEYADGIQYVAADDGAEMGFFADDLYEFAEDEDDVGELAEDEDEIGYFGQDYEEIGEEDDMGYFAEEEEGVEGYVVEREPAFNQRVMPVDAVSGIEGYTKPKTVNPTCASIRPAEEVSTPARGWFEPLW